MFAYAYDGFFSGSVEDNICRKIYFALVIKNIKQRMAIGKLICNQEERIHSTYATGALLAAVSWHAGSAPLMRCWQAKFKYLLRIEATADGSLELATAYHKMSNSVASTK